MDDEERNVEKKSSNIQLKRELGLLNATAVTITAIIGSGIFIAPSNVLRETGSVGLCLIIWTISGLIAHLGALVYSELGVVLSVSGAEYSCYQETFGKLGNGKTFLGSLPAFLYVFISLISRPAGMATLLLTSSEYIVELLSISYPYIDKLFYKKIIGLVALGMITLVNSIGVRFYLSFVNLFSSLKILACLIVVSGGAYYLSLGHSENLSKGFEGTNTGVGNIALAFYSGLWAYEGWSSLLEISEEIKSPNRNIPLSVFISVSLVTVLYITMNIAYMSVLSMPEMLKSQAVAVGFGEKLFPPLSIILTVSVVFSTFSGAMTDQFGHSRLCYAAAKNGHVMEIFCYIHRKRYTPIPYLIFQCMLTGFYIATGSIVQLLVFTSYIHWLFRSFTMISFFILRKRMPDAPRPYKVPLVVPILILMFSVFMVIIPLVTSPNPMFLFAVIMLAVGTVIYYVVVYKKRQPACLGKFNNWVKDVFNLASPELEKDDKDKTEPEVKPPLEKYSKIIPN